LLIQANRQPKDITGKKASVINYSVLSRAVAPPSTIIA
jgi:hypothetical protein